MELTVYAAWLNDTFALFDSFVLGLHHELALQFGEYLAMPAHVLDVGGHLGVMFGVFAVLLMFFRKTRMAGVAIIVGMAIAGGLSEFIIKDLVARPRPFEMSDTFYTWWQFVGSADSHGTSFPSGHVAGCTAAMIALSYAARRWWVSLLGVLMILAMAIDRMYLIVHYPSDVLGGFILGFVSGVIGYAIVQGIWRMMGKHPDQLAEARAAAANHAASVQLPYGNQAAQYPYPSQGAQFPPDVHDQQTVQMGSVGQGQYADAPYTHAATTTAQLPQQPQRIEDLRR